MWMVTAMVLAASATEFQVVDAQGSPLGDAKVFAYHCMPNARCTTVETINVDESGRFVVDGATRLRVESPGYLPYVADDGLPDSSSIALTHTSFADILKSIPWCRCPTPPVSLGPGVVAVAVTGNRRLRRTIQRSVDSVDLMSCRTEVTSEPNCPRLSYCSVTVRFSVRKGEVADFEVQDELRLFQHQVDCLAQALQSLPLDHRDKGLVEVYLWDWQ